MKKIKNLELPVRIVAAAIVLRLVLVSAPAVETRWVDWFDTLGGPETNGWDRYSLAVVFLGMVALATLGTHLLFLNSVRFGPVGRFHPINLVDYIWYLGGGLLVAVTLHQIQITQMNTQFQQNVSEASEIAEFLRSEETLKRIQQACDLLTKEEVAAADRSEFSMACEKFASGVEPTAKGDLCGGPEMYYHKNANHSVYPQSETRSASISRSMNFLLLVCGKNVELAYIDRKVVDQRSTLNISESEFDLDRLLSIYYLFSFLVGLKLLKTSSSVLSSGETHKSRTMGRVERFF